MRIFKLSSSKSIWQQAKQDLERTANMPGRISAKRLYNHSKDFIKSIGAANRRKQKSIKLYEKRNITVIRKPPVASQVIISYLE